LRIPATLHKREKHEAVEMAFPGMQLFLLFSMKRWNLAIPFFMASNLLLDSPRYEALFERFCKRPALSIQ
jgi:hypothetical protein